MPLNAGVLAPVELLVPEGTILRPSKYAAVSSGNTETSQRVCDVIFKAFEACAASQGEPFLLCLSPSRLTEMIIGCMNVFQANYQDMAYGETSEFNLVSRRAEADLAFLPHSLRWSGRWANMGRPVGSAHQHDE